MDLSGRELCDSESVDLELELLSLVPCFFGELANKCKSSVQTNSGAVGDLTLLKAIDVLNCLTSDSLSLCGLRRRLLMQLNGVRINRLVCLNNFIDQEVEEHVGQAICPQRGTVFSMLAVYQPDIGAILSAIIESQTGLSDLNAAYDRLRHFPAATSTAFSFIDESTVENGVIEDLRNSIAYSSPSRQSSRHEQLLPSLVHCSRSRSSFPLRSNRQGSLDTIQRLPAPRSTLLQSMHNVTLKENRSALVKQFSAIDIPTVHRLVAPFSNVEARKLDVRRFQVMVSA
jgi:hypothetical protein